MIQTLLQRVPTTFKTGLITCHGSQMRTQRVQTGPREGVEWASAPGLRTPNFPCPQRSKQQTWLEYDYTCQTPLRGTVGVYQISASQRPFMIEQILLPHFSVEKVQHRAVKTFALGHTALSLLCSTSPSRHPPSACSSYKTPPSPPGLWSREAGRDPDMPFWPPHWPCPLAWTCRQREPGLRTSPAVSSGIMGRTSWWTRS